MHLVHCKKFEKTIFDGADGEKAWSSVNLSIQTGALFNNKSSKLPCDSPALILSCFAALLYFGILVMSLVNLIGQFGKHHAKKKHLENASCFFTLAKHWTVNRKDFDIKFQILLDTFSFDQFALSDTPSSPGVLKTVSLFLLLPFAITYKERLTPRILIISRAGTPRMSIEQGLSGLTCQGVGFVLKIRLVILI
jgi:hypothetical protein